MYIVLGHGQDNGHEDLGMLGVGMGVDMGVGLTRTIGISYGMSNQL